MNVIHHQRRNARVLAEVSGHGPYFDDGTSGHVMRTIDNAAASPKLLCQCWCRRGFWNVDKADIRNGLTESCGRTHCNMLNHLARGGRR